ncbi:MAG: hypothetical protein Q9163_001480 [Psora crenata]
MSKIHRGPYTIEKFRTIQVPLEFLLAYSIQRDACQFLWRTWAALIAEFCLSFQEVILGFNVLLALFSTTKKNPRPRYCLVGQSAPSVDVLITCCGEPIDVIIDTVTAAAAQDYPTECLRVFVLDDGHNEKLQKALEALSTDFIKRGFAQTMYLSRTVQYGAKSYFKAGNLNFGIDETRRFGPSQYIAGLDADMIPSPDWLRLMVPHLIMEDRAGMAVTPQQYYNVPPGDPLGQQADFSMYFTVQEVLNDYLDGSMCTGTGYVARRSALGEIGGWPLAETGEDFMCSTHLSNSGWKVAFVRDKLQYGLCPESMGALLKQRMRWTDAGIEVHQQFGFYLKRSGIAAQMTWPQRAVNLLYALRDYAPMTNILALLILPVALYPTDQTHQFATSIVEHHQSLTLLRKIFLATFIVNKLHYFILYNHVGISQVWNFQSNEIWAAPYMAYRCLISFLPSGFSTPTFAVCGSIPADERSLIHRKPLPSRLYSYDMLMYTLYITHASIPLILHFHASTSVSHPSAALSPFPGAMVKLASSILKVTVPLRYMLWPPTVPQRDKLLEEDGRGVRRPKTERKTGGWLAWVLIAVLEFSVFWWSCGEVVM